MRTDGEYEQRELANGQAIASLQRAVSEHNILSMSAKTYIDQLNAQIEHMRADHTRVMNEAVGNYNAQVQHVESRAAEEDRKLRSELFSKIGAIESENDQLRLSLATVSFQPTPDSALQEQHSKFVCEIDEALERVKDQNLLVQSLQSSLKIAEEERDRAKLQAAVSGGDPASSAGVAGVGEGNLASSAAAAASSVDHELHKK